jgi:hypothetical protein
MHIHFNPGLQWMNGEQALEYARSRETTSDFDRSKRQQIILMAIRQRVLSLNAVPQLFSLMGALQDNVRTNLKPDDMKAIADFGSKMKDQDIHRISIDTSNLLISGHSSNGQYILTPRDPTYRTIQQILANALPAPAALAEKIPVQLQDGSRRYWTPYTGSPAQVMSGLLEGLGLNVHPAGATTVQQTQILDGSGGKAASTISWLQQFFNAKVVVVPTPTTGPVVTLALGPDFTLKAFPYSSPNSAPGQTTPRPTPRPSPRPTPSPSALPSASPTH